MKLVITKASKKISVCSKQGRIVNFGNVVGVFYPSIKSTLLRSPDVTNTELVGLLEKAGVHSDVGLNQFADTPPTRGDVETNKTVLLKVYIGKPEAEKIHKLQAAMWPINPTTYLGIERVVDEQHNFTGFDSALCDLDVIDFADLPPYVHLLVEQLINQEPVGYALTSHVLQEIEDRAYQMTV